MATITYKPSNTATFGSSGSAVVALQTQLNNQFAGVAGYTPLKVDGKYGPLTQAATQFQAPQPAPVVNNGLSTIPGPYDPATGKLKTDPTLSSTTTRSTYTALGNDINTFTNAAGLSSYNDRANQIINDRMATMKADYEADIGGIKTAYEEANRIQTERQNQDYAGRSTGLVTSGGGFLGTTQSHQGVLQNLTNTFTNEKNALMAKRDAALQAARNAYDDKAFGIAIQQLNLAKETEKTIYDRQKDFADQQLQLAKEDRAQQEFDMGITDKKIAGYVAMSDSDFAKLPPAQIAEADKHYYPGYTANKRAIEKTALDTKTKKEAIALDSDILDMRLKMPQGQKFTLAGVTYTGLKKPDAGAKPTVDERNASIRTKISTLFSPGYTIPNSDGIPYIDSQGFATPEGWKVVIKTSGLDRADFIKQYGYLIPADNIKPYGLTRPEQELVQGKL